MTVSTISEDHFATQFAAAYQDVAGEPIPDDFGLDASMADLELDSISRLEVVQCLEDLLEVTIDDEKMRAVRTPRDLLQMINSSGLAGKKR
ncbi:acyl carrier protein [Actinoplanes lutulentus]|uniref:Phosphopantetheine binding protein n=1 Tax=Actinoplanes lutulentus TaxID=1287878 RepID=A0A327ZQ27_9ACTN|nr:acyl carrier protein [Actinoplanes lutulentus]MBB2940586.1 acyl carrier protein [Actinoplanes lutulentus]RAK42898.1 phosphopantetheine binding protein [Actinoplanes lutulentus]